MSDLKALRANLELQARMSKVKPVDPTVALREALATPKEAAAPVDKLNAGLARLALTKALNANAVDAEASFFGESSAPQAQVAIPTDNSTVVITVTNGKVTIKS